MCVCESKRIESEVWNDYGVVCNSLAMSKMLSSAVQFGFDIDMRIFMMRSKRSHRMNFSRPFSTIQMMRLCQFKGIESLKKELFSEMNANCNYFYNKSLIRQCAENILDVNYTSFVVPVFNSVHLHSRFRANRGKAKIFFSESIERFTLKIFRYPRFFCYRSVYIYHLAYQFKWRVTKFLQLNG